jgi:hypothetical protein
MRISEAAAEFRRGLPKNIREFICQSGFLSSGTKLGTSAKPQVERTRHKQTLSGWWYTYPFGNMSSSVEMMTFPTEWKNHPVMFQTINQL